MGTKAFKARWQTQGGYYVTIQQIQQHINDVLTNEDIISTEVLACMRHIITPGKYPG